MAPMDEIVLEKWTNLLAFRPHIKTQSILFHRNIRTDSIAILNYIIEFEHRTQNADNLRSFYLCEFGINKTKIQFEFTNSGPFFNVSKTITKFCTRPLESRLRFPLPFDVVFGKAFSCVQWDLFAPFMAKCRACEPISTMNSCQAFSLILQPIYWHTLTRACYIQW